MQVAASMSVGRLAPKHSLNIDNIRVISKNVTPKLIKNDVILIDRLRSQDGKHLTIEEYTDQHFQPYIDQYNAKQRRKDRQIQVGYCEWHRGNGVLSQGKGELAYEAVLQYGTHEDIGGEYYADTTSQERKAELQEEFISVYREWVEAIQRDYPHLTILYAVIHFSETEGTPHLHVCFQPEADCTRGLAKQVSIGRALAQDGIERIDTRAEAEQSGGFQLARFYQKFHHEYQNKTLQRLGYEIKAETHGLKHMEKDGYAVVMADAQQKAQNLVQTAEHRKKRVEEETDRIKNKALNLVYEAQEATIAAKQERVRVERETADIEAQAASVKEQAIKESEQIIINARVEAQLAQKAAETAKAEQERAEHKKAAAEAQTEAIRQQAKEEADKRCKQLEWQLSQAEAYIAEQQTLIDTLRDKLQSLKIFLQEHNAFATFVNWMQRRQEPEHEHSHGHHHSR